MRLCTEYAYLPAIDADGRKQGQKRMETSAPALIFSHPRRLARRISKQKNWNDTEIIFYFGAPVF